MPSASNALKVTLKISAQEMRYLITLSQFQIPSDGLAGLQHHFLFNIW